VQNRSHMRNSMQFYVELLEFGLHLASLQMVT